LRTQLTKEQRQLAFRLRKDGWTLMAIGKALGFSHTSIRATLLSRQKGVAPDSWVPRSGRLNVHEREEILLGLHRGESMLAIARTLGRAASTVTREVAANGGREEYRIWRAHQRARACTKRPKSAKLDCPVLCARVTTRLEEFWSPKEIANRLALDFPDDPAMRVSHETIHQSLFVQGRGELRRELVRCLRSGERLGAPRVTLKRAAQCMTWS
jgi:IS30 family transposase